jgi:glycosyltransferase involved in cell wall biosynthesis
MTDPRFTRAPRVLLVCDHLLRYAAGVGEGLRARGAHVALVTRDHAEEFDGDRDAMHAEVRARLGPDTPVWWLPGRIRERGALPVAREIAAEVRRFGPDLVHAQDSVVHDPRLLWVARLRPRRFAVTLHDPRPHPGDVEPSLRMRMTREGLLAAARLVFVHGEGLREELLDVARAPLPPVEVVPHGTDAQPVTPPPREPTLLFFGRMSRYKGLDVLLDAMPRVWARVPDARLVVAGQGPLPHAEALRDPRVEVHNRHIPDAEVPALFRRASVVTLPYLQASQSGVGSQAKAHGRPIVATRAGELPHLVADGSGVVVPKGDPVALAREAVALLTDEQRALRMGLAGARTAAVQTSWETVGAAMLRAYERHGLLPRPPASRGAMEAQPLPART